MCRPSIKDGIFQRTAFYTAGVRRKTQFWGQRLLFLITITNHSHVCSQANKDWQFLLWRRLLPVSNLTVFSRNIHLSFSVLVYISCGSCIYFYNMVRDLGEHLRIYSWYWQLQQIRGGILSTFFRLHSCWGYLEDKNIDFIFCTVQETNRMSLTVIDHAMRKCDCL